MRKTITDMSGDKIRVYSSTGENDEAVVVGIQEGSTPEAIVGLDRAGLRSLIEALQKVEASLENT